MWSSTFKPGLTVCFVPSTVTWQCCTKTEYSRTSMRTTSPKRPLLQNTNFFSCQIIIVKTSRKLPWPLSTLVIWIFLLFLNFGKFFAFVLKFPYDKIFRADRCCMHWNSYKLVCMVPTSDPPQHYVAGTHLYTWVERDKVEQSSCPRKQRRQRPGSNHRPSSWESDALTTRPPRVHKVTVKTY